jgi:hypothetical protein
MIVIKPGAIREAVEALQKDAELGMVYGDVQSVDENGNTIHVQRFEQYIARPNAVFHHRPAIGFHAAGRCWNAPDTWI